MLYEYVSKSSDISIVYYNLIIHCKDEKLDFSISETAFVRLFTFICNTYVNKNIHLYFKLKSMFCKTRNKPQSSLYIVQP